MKKRYQVTGMTCAACQSHVENACKSLEGMNSVSVNLLSNTMDVEFDSSVCTEEMICSAVEKAGYGLGQSKGKKKEKEKDFSFIALLVSFVFLFLLMYFSMGVMMWDFPAPPIFDMEQCPMGFSLIQFVLVLPILFLQRGYFIRGFKRLFHNPSMDSLIAVGATASMLYSIYILFSIAYDPNDTKMLHMSLYFEAAGMILCFVGLGKYLEGLSKKKTTKALEALMDLSPKEAVIEKDGQQITVPISEIKRGDLVIVKQGALVPVDGVIQKGSGTFDQSNITGESLPVYKQKEDEVYCSTVMMSGYCEILATKVGEDTTFATILHLVEEASNSKAPISKLADSISRIFVPLIFIISLLVFIGNFLYVELAHPEYTTNAFQTALNYAITDVVIACPCALGLATPVAVMVGTGKGAQNGLIIKNAEILERTGKIETMVFDKTGTITKGHPEVTDSTLDKETLEVIAAMEAMSLHPLALAIQDYARKMKCRKVEISAFKEIDGSGLEASYKENVYYIGNEKNNTDYDALAKEGKTVLYIKKNNSLIGILALRDEVKENSIYAIEELKKMNIRCIMLTGDNQNTARAIADSVGIDEVISDVLPGEKAKVINNLRKDGMLVSMVGDGVNDAPALTASDLGIAIGGGSDVASESADIVLVRNDLLDAVNAIRLSRRVLFTIKLGLFWAFIYNAICVVLASGLFYHISKGSFIMKPEYGSIAMSISSVSVVLNALSINLFKMKIGIRKEKEEMATLVIGVDGMMCKHCKAHVEEACKNVAGVISAVASLEDKNVTVECSAEVTKEELEASIKDAGYDIR